MEHVSTASSWPMTLIALGGPGRSHSKCQSSRSPSISHSKEACPCAADGKAGWVPHHIPFSNQVIKLFQRAGRLRRSSSMLMHVHYPFVIDFETYPEPTSSLLERLNSVKS